MALDMNTDLTSNASSSPPSRKSLYPYLTYLGALPFVVSAVFLALGVHVVPVLGLDVYVLLASYGTVIVSYMSGVHWGQSVGLGIHNTAAGSRFVHAALPIVSNIVTLVAWFSLLLAGARLHLAVLVIAFISLLLIDGYLAKRNMISRPYFKMRVLVTAIVAISLVISFTFVTSRLYSLGL